MTCCTPRAPEQAIGLERGRWTQGDQNRAVRCLTTMGFKLYWARRGERREKRYRRPPTKQSNVVALSTVRNSNRGNALGNTTATVS
jgi:hypothetical protein